MRNRRYSWHYKFYLKSIKEYRNTLETYPSDTDWKGEFVSDLLDELKSAIEVIQYYSDFYDYEPEDSATIWLKARGYD